jgi:hypothetical protein
MYNISQANISNIVRGISWNYINEEGFLRAE